VFEWREKEEGGHLGHTVWGLFTQQTEYFQPSRKDFMLNYRVENLQELLTQLRKEGVQVVGEIETYEYGRFGWIMDPEGNKVELREPNDEVFRRMNGLDAAPYDGPPVGEKTPPASV
jgi:predicted enzyme related to lactoylglutathione lyase